MGAVELSSRKSEHKESDRVQSSGHRDTFQKQATNRAGLSGAVGGGLLDLQSALGNRAVLSMLSSNGSLAEGGGSPIPENVKTKMEASFGTDFSDVRTHESPQAGEMGARAMARGADIFFAPGQFAPSTREGQSLLGHELSHVVQQREGKAEIPQGNVFPLVDTGSLESEADQAGERASRGEKAAGLHTAGGHVSGSAFQVGAAAHSESAPVQASFFSSLASGIKKGFSAVKKFATSPQGKQMIGGALSFGSQALAGSKYGQGGTGSLLASGMNVAGGMVSGNQQDSATEEASEEAGSEKTEEEKALEEEKEGQ